MVPDFKVTATEEGLMIAAKLPGLRISDLEITVEGKRLRIVGNQSDGHGPFETVMDLPHGFDLCQANVTYLNDELRIIIPPVTNQRKSSAQLFSCN